MDFTLSVYVLDFIILRFAKERLPLVAWQNEDRNLIFKI